MARMRKSMVVALVAAAVSFAAGRAWAHCDTLDGPVVVDARAALEAGDVTSVLKWVQPADETAIREAFAKTLEVRKQSEAARELADRYFFETLVRVHRAGEGAPYTGLKPAGEVDAGIAAADKAIENGSPNQLLAEMTARVTEGIRDRFVEVMRARQEASAHPQDIEAGRRAVAAYVEYIHFVEQIQEAASTPAREHGEAPPHEH